LKGKYNPTYAPCWDWSRVNATVKPEHQVVIVRD